MPAFTPRTLLPIGLGAIALTIGLSGCLRDWTGNGQMADSRSAATITAANSGANPGVFELANPSAFSRVVAISDVHGMVHALMPILQAGQVIDANHRWVGGKTLVLVLGDSIDKGPDSLDVLDFWSDLDTQARAAGGQVVHLLGNHEAEFLANPANDSKATELYAELTNEHVPISQLTDPNQPRGAFLRHMPVAAKVGRWLFCHAGLYPDMSWSAFKAKAADVLGRGAYGDAFLQDPNSILEAKDWWQDPATRASLESRLETNGMFGVVQGHQPKAYNMPNTTGSIDNGHLIKIDNGMAPEAGSNPGHLLVFPNPADLSVDAAPQAIAIGPDGSTINVVTRASAGHR